MENRCRFLSKSQDLPKQNNEETQENIGKTREPIMGKQTSKHTHRDRLGKTLDRNEIKYRTNEYQQVNNCKNIENIGTKTWTMLCLDSIRVVFGMVNMFVKFVRRIWPIWPMLKVASRYRLTLHLYPKRCFTEFLPHNLSTLTIFWRI